MAISHSYLEAAVEELVRTLRGSRVLTRASLRKAVDGADWPDGMFERALELAIKHGRIVRLDEELLEIGPHEQV